MDEPATSDGDSRAPADWSGAAGFVLLLVLAVVAPLGRGLFFAPDRDAFTVVVAVVVLWAGVTLAIRWSAAPVMGLAGAAALVYCLGYWLAYRLRPAVPFSALEGAERAGLLLGWYWLAATFVRGTARLRWFALTLYGSGVLLAALGCLAAAGRFAFPGAVAGQRILSTLQYANALGAVLVTTTVLGAGLMVDAWAGTAGSRGRARGRRMVAAAVIGAGNVLSVVALLGTVSRGAWVIFVVASILWLLGLPAVQRWRGVAAGLWPLGLGLLVSRPVLGGFWGGRPSHALLALAAAMVFGAAGTGLLPRLERAWNRQRFTPEVRAVLHAVAGLYAAAVLAFLLFSTGGAAAAVSGGGLVAPTVARRAATITLGTPDLLQRVVYWRDALRLVRSRPLVGYGGGGWAALYHSVQSGLYWSSEVHQALLQAWVDGGLAAAAGLLGLGAAVLLSALRLRRAQGSLGTLGWTLAVAVFAIWMHAQVDFDLAIPAVALVLWGAAGALEAAGATEPRPVRWQGATMAKILGLAASVALGLLLLLPTARLQAAGILAGAGSGALSARRYAAAYRDYSGALRLEPLAPTYLADRAQLLLVAYTVDHRPATAQNAADEAMLAEQVGTGNLQVDSLALDVLFATGRWEDAAAAASGLVRQFPLDAQAFDLAGPALVQSAEGGLQAGAFTAAAPDLRLAASLPGLWRRGYAVRATPLSRRFFGQPPADAVLLFSEGQALAILGRWSAAESLFSRVVEAGGPGAAAEASAWLWSVDVRSGRITEARATFAPLAHDRAWLAASRQALRWTGFAPEVGTLG